MFRNSYALIAFLLVVVAAAGAVLWRQADSVPGMGRVITTGQIDVGGPFQLIDQNGRKKSDADFRGRYMLIYFGYSFCPDVCPTTLGVMADALGKLGAGADKVVPVFITVDPERDTPKVLKQYMARGDSPTRGRELNIHFGDLDRGFIGQISPLGDMVPVMAGVTLSFRTRGEDRVGLVYVGDGATSTGAFHEGINFAAVQRCPLVVVVENNGYAYSTPTSKQTAAASFADKALAYGIPGERADGNDVLATYDVTKRAVDRARRGEGVTLIELMTYRRKGHAEHDNQSYVPPGEIERWETTNDPLDRYVKVLLDDVGATRSELAAIDERVQTEIDAATDLAEASPAPEATDALRGVYADPPAMAPLWYREGIASAVSRHERPAGWGTYNG